MDNETISKICDGDIDLLKKISKSHFTKDICIQLVANMESNKLEIQNLLDTNSYSSDFKDFCIYYRSKLKYIDNCISYLKKIT